MRPLGTSLSPNGCGSSSLEQNVLSGFALNVKCAAPIGFKGMICKDAAQPACLCHVVPLCSSRGNSEGEGAVVAREGCGAFHPAVARKTGRYMSRDAACALPM